MTHPRTKLLHAVLIVAIIGTLLPPLGLHPRPAQARQSVPVAFEPPPEAARPPAKNVPDSTLAATEPAATTNPADTDACILVANSSVYLPLVVRGGGVSGSSTTTPELPIRSSANTASLKGRVLDANDAANGIETPLFGVTICSLETGLSVKTDPNGEFLLTGLPAGESHVQYIGDTVAPANSYASYRSKIELVDNTTKVIDRPIYLMKKDAGGEVQIDPNQTTVVDNANLGVTLTIPAHTVKNEDGSDYSGPLSVSEVPAGFTPGSLPDTLEPGFVTTIQPMGLNFAQPVPVTFPNTDNLPPGTELDIWSMDHDTGKFFVAGRGQVSSDGSVINTTSGGVREASWHFLLGLIMSWLGISDADGNNQSPTNSCQGFGSLVSTHNGSLQTDISLPGYVSMGRYHTLNLVYNSNRAYPFQLVPVEPTIPVRAALPPKLSMTYDVTTAAISQTGYVSTAGLNEDVDEPLRAVLPLDTTNLSTGAYDGSMRVTSHYNRSAVTTARNRPLVVVNEQNSPFGAGWGLSGLQRLHVQANGSALITDGSGAALHFDTKQVLLSDDFDAENNGIGRLNFNNLANWDITDGTIDLIGNGTNDFIPGNGLYLDLDGSTRNAGRIETKNSFILDPGIYELEFDLAGSNRPFLPASDTVVISLGNVYSETLTLDRNEGFQTINRLITVSNQETSKLVFDHAGGDNFGILLDNVSFARLNTTNLRSPEGDYSSLTKNSDGTYTRRLKDGTEIQFDSAGLQTAMVDRNGNTTAYAYDAQNRLTSITDPAGLATTLSYSGSLLNRVTLPDGRVTIFTYSGSDLTGVIFPDGSSQAFGYDSRHLMTSETDQRGNVKSRQFDTYGRLTQASMPDGSTRATLTSQKVGLIDPASGVGTENNPAPVERPSNVWSELTDGEGRLRKFTSGPVNTFANVTNAAGLTTDYERDEDGNATKITRPTGAIYDQSYDNRGNLTGVTDRTLAGTTSFAYDSTYNQVTAITDPFNKTTNFSYDAAGNLTQLTTPLNRTATFEYDSRGLVTRAVDPLGTEATFSYNGNGNLTQMTQGSGPAQRTASLSYTPEGYVDTLTDPLGRVFDTNYDSLGRPVSESLPGGRSISYGYDSAGNLTSLTPPGQPAQTFSYNSMGLVSAYTPPGVSGDGSNQTLYSYNNAQELTQITRPDGQTLNVAYDSAGRVDTLTIPRGQLDTTYSASTGQVTSLAAPEGVNMGYTYNGDLLKSVTWSGPINGSVVYDYDEAARLTRVSVKSNNINYTYDADNRVTQAAGLGLAYNSQSGLLNTTSLDNINDSRTFNQFAELTGYSAAVSGSPLYTTQYGRDALGRIITKSETITAVTTNIAYSYDAAGRLATVQTNGAVTEQYSYDLNGNRLTAFGGIAATHDDQDRLLTYGSNSYSYTANGELLTKTNGSGTTNYDYDALGNLMGVTLPGGDQITYLVDGENRRIGKKVNGTLQRAWLYQDDLNPVVELDGAGNLSAIFVYAGQSHVPDYMNKGGTRYRLVTDHLGSVRLVVNATTGAIAQRLDYDAFGRVLLDTNPGFQPFGFAGGLYDPDTGLVRFGARDYDAEVGRWTVKDPIGFAGGDANLYTYVGGDVVNFVDPTGYIVCGGLCIGAIVTGGVAAIHWTRNYWNEPVSDFDDVQGWTELTPEESIFHRMGPGNEDNRKFVSPDGRSEAVFKPSDCGGKPTLVTDPANMGTYNFFGPRFAWGIPHGIFDVAPYFVFGNSPSDMFNLDRFRVLFK